MAPVYLQDDGEYSRVTGESFLIDSLVRCDDGGANHRLHDLGHLEQLGWLRKVGRVVDGSLSSILIDHCISRSISQAGHSEKVKAHASPVPTGE